MKSCIGPYFEFKLIERLPKDDRAELLNRGVLSPLKYGYSFNASGIFSTAKNIYIVLPWILSQPNQDEASYRRSALSNVFHSFKWFAEGISKSYGKSSHAQDASEFLHFSLFMSLKEALEVSVNYNVFRSTESVLPVVKGKWKMETDVALNHQPILFTCLTDECDRNHPIFVTALQYCELLEIRIGSRILRRDVQGTIEMLRSISNNDGEIEDNLEDALKLARSDRRFSHWVDWLNFLKEHFGSIKDDITSFAELKDFKFETAVFFEESIRFVLDYLELDFTCQKPSAILGGSFWGGVEQIKEDVPRLMQLNRLSSRYTSRPDYFIFRKDKKPILLECKYKQYFFTKHTHQGLEYSSVNSFQTSDRNQILSFILSQSSELKFEPRSIVVIFPLLEDLDHSAESAYLTFNATTSYDEAVNLNWCSRNYPVPENNITIHFFGAKILKMLSELNVKNEPQTEIDRFRKFIAKLA